MARCVKCGDEAAKPVWAVYADPAFDRKQQTPFPLHARCFNESETITAAEWTEIEAHEVEIEVPDPDSDDDDATTTVTVMEPQRAELVEIENAPRYRKVEAP
jgi:hypothetical protein